MFQTILAGSRDLNKFYDVTIVFFSNATHMHGTTMVYQNSNTLQLGRIYNAKHIPAKMDPSILLIR